MGLAPLGDAATRDGGCSGREFGAVAQDEGEIAATGAAFARQRRNAGPTAAVACGGSLYGIGGYVGGTNNAFSDVYFAKPGQDGGVATTAWRSTASLPVALQCGWAVRVGAVAYCIGGKGSNATGESKVYHARFRQ